MSRSAQLKRDLRDAMSDTLDGLMANFGFVRKKRSYSYFRTLGHARQELLISAVFNRRYIDEEFAIVPIMRVYMKEVSRVALDLVGEGGGHLLIDPYIIIGQEIDYAMREGGFSKWRASNIAQIRDQLISIANFFTKKNFPLLNNLGNYDGIIRIIKENDERFIKSDQFYIFVAAACLLNGDKEEAERIVNNRFSSVLFRDIYSSVLENVKKYDICA